MRIRRGRSRSGSSKDWQVNTVTPPEKAEDGVILRNSVSNLTGTIDVRMLRPAPGQRKLQILSGKDAHTVFGHEFTPPSPAGPQANGHRVMFSPTEPKRRDEFLTVMLIADEKAEKPPVGLTELAHVFVLTIADRTVVLSRSEEPVNEAIEVAVNTADTGQLILTGLAPGPWNVRGTDPGVRLNLNITAEKPTAFLSVGRGKHIIAPGSAQPAEDRSEQSGGRES